MTSIPAPKRTFRLEPMTRTSSKEFWRGMKDTTQDMLAFLALVIFIATIAGAAALVSVPAPGV